MPVDGPGHAGPTPAGDELLEISYRQAGDDEIVAIAGELDAFTEPIVEPLLEAFARQGGDVRLDLSGITFLDVRGLHLLDGTARSLDRQGGCLIVEQPSRAVTRLCEIARRSSLELSHGLRIA